MQSRRDPSYFFANSIDDTHGNLLGWMNPNLRSSRIYLSNSSSSVDAIRYSGLKIGKVPGRSSMVRSTSRNGGILRSSSGNISGNSQTTEGCSIADVVKSSDHKFTTPPPFLVGGSSYKSHLPVHMENVPFFLEVPFFDSSSIYDNKIDL